MVVTNRPEEGLLPMAIDSVTSRNYAPRSQGEPVVDDIVIDNVPVELLAYASLFLLAALFRIAALDAVMLSNAEASMALSAWHAVAGEAPGTASSADSPLTHISQIMAFSTLGPSEFSARIGSALAGIALVFTPLLFRDSFGQTRTFIWSALLALLTVPVAAARVADGTTFMLLFAILAIWMIRRFWYSQQKVHAAWAMLLVALMLFLSSPRGIPLLLILLLAGWLAVWRTALSAPQRLDLPGDDILQLAMKRLREFPFTQVAMFPALVTLLIATLFMLYPAGLRTVSQLMSESLTGITQSRAPDELRLGFLALISSELLLIIFASGGAWLLWKKGDVTYIDRFAAAWAMVGALGLLLYPGATASDALWVVVPLTLLASYGITQLMVNRRVVLLWSEPADDEDASETELYTTSYWWVKWIISAGVFAMLLVLSVQAAQVARLMLDLPANLGIGELPAQLLEPAQLRLLQGVGLLVIAAIIGLVVFALVASFWGMNTTLQGLGLGFFWLMLLSGVGGAWSASVSRATEPDGLWRTSAVTDEAALLRATLFDLADRETSGFPLLDFTVVLDADAADEERKLVAWLLRDYPSARIVSAPAEAAGAPIILMAERTATDALPGDYVGQRFVLRRHWAVNQASALDLPAWWTQRRIRAGGVQEDALVLWLRQDVYDGVPAEKRL